MNEYETDTQVPKKKALQASNIKRGSIVGAVITAIASLGYAEIQREENETLLKTNTELVRMITEDAKDCRDLMVQAYERGLSAGQN